MHETEKWKWSRSVVSDSSDPMNCSLPGSSVHGIFQARVLEWGAIAFSGCLVAKLFQFFCDSLDYNLPGSSVHGILQARMLEWVVMSFCRGPFQPRDQTNISHVSCIGRQILYHLSHQGSPMELKSQMEWHPTSVLLPGKSHGWRSLVGCSPWGR